MSYLKPQNPIKLNNDYIYPLTTADQVITGSGERLNSLFKKTIKETATLQVANWSDTKPYTQTITLNYSVDDYNVDANIAYGDEDNAALHAAAGCISYIKKNHKEITFYCLKSKPEVDIPVEITGTCRNTIATIEEGIKLNFDIVAYANEEELLADTPMENTIGVITDTPITGYKFSATEPESMNDGEVWIVTGDDSSVAFDIVEGAEIYPLSVKQYVSDAWVNKTAMSYQNGEWVNWVFYLFIKGNEHTELTGGWVSLSPGGYIETIPVTGPTFEKENILKISTTGNSTHAVKGAFRTSNKIDFTDINTIEFNIIDANIETEYGFIMFGLHSTDYMNESDLIAGSLCYGSNVPQLGSLKVSTENITGNYYVSIAIYGWISTSVSITVDEIRIW